VAKRAAERRRLREEARQNAENEEKRLREKLLEGLAQVGACVSCS
jgi:hypothetical protein